MRRFIDCWLGLAWLAPLCGLATPNKASLATRLGRGKERGLIERAAFPRNSRSVEHSVNQNKRRKELFYCVLYGSHGGS